MDSNELEISNTKGLGCIRFPRVLAQGNYKVPDKHKIKIVNKNGDVSYRNPTTIVDEKIADTCIQIFQSSNIAKEMDYKILREKAENSLEERFKTYNMVLDESKHNKADLINIKKNREIAIHQWIRNYIENNLDFKFFIDFDKFISMTGIKSASRIGYALNMIYEIKSKASHEYKIPIISEDFSTIDYEYKIVKAIPEISLVLDEEMGQKYANLIDFIKADIKNKKKHIKKISFEISKSYVSAILGLGRDYTETNRKQRDMFKSTYAFKLDILIKSIAGVQSSSKFNKYTFEEIKERLGSNITDYRIFKKNVLMPALEDLNNYTDYDIELVETRLSRKVDFISFNIKLKNKSDSNLKYGVDKVAYYIASRLYYFTANKILNLIGYANHIEEQIQDNQLTIYEGKYLEEWKEEAEREFKIEEELLKFIQDNQKIFETKNIIYDEKRMCIVEKTIVLKDTEKSPELENIRIDKDIKPEEKIKTIKTRDYNVTNPSTSLRYIHEVLLKELPKESSIIDFLPFSILNGKGLVQINDIETFLRYKQLIQYNIIEKNLTFFRFDDDHLLKELFYTKVLHGEFREISSEFRDMVKRLYTYDVTPQSTKTEAS